jgi:CO/xanthine dehydrogenase Mo-binding subunit
MLFIHDIVPKRALRAMVYRSPFRKGRILSLREPVLPRGYHCVKPQDIPGARVLSYMGYSLPVLARSEARYLGEPLMLFCGPDPEMLAELCEAVELSYREEAPVEYKDLSGPYKEAQIIDLAHGEADLAFSLAEQIVEGEYRTARQEHDYPDTLGAVADWDGKLLTVHAATQDPFALRSALCRCLDLPPRKLRVVCVPMGNTMEGKLLSSMVVAAQAALLSHRAGKPVVLTYDREEELFSPKGPQFLIRHQTALDREGGTLAVRVQIYMDGGCYAPRDCEALRGAVHSAWGAYRVPSLEVTGRTVTTDSTPIGSFRASGRAQAFFAAELHSSRLEEISQLDPHTWKKQNLVEPGRREETSVALAVMEAAVNVSDFTRKYSAYSAVKKRRKDIDQAAYPLRGIGLSLTFQDEQGCRTHLYASEEPRSACTMKVVLDRGRRLRIYCSLVDCAMGIHELLVRRAAELLELDAEKVSVAAVDTQKVPDTGPTSFSRAVSVGLLLLEQCCQALLRKRGKIAPPIEVRRSLSPDGRLDAGAGEVRRRARGTARGGASWAATVVELELDPVTLLSACRGVWMVVEAGTVLNRKAAVQALEGEISRALGSISLQGVHEPDGSLLCSSDNLLPGAGEFPEIQIHLLSGSGPMRGFEQLPHLGVPPAYAAAASQATGLYIDQMPITAEVIQQCLEA